MIDELTIDQVCKQKLTRQNSTFPSVREQIQRLREVLCVEVDGHDGVVSREGLQSQSRFVLRVHD